MVFGQVHSKPLILALLLKITLVSGQYPPQAGLPGSTAIPWNSPLIKYWATSASVKRGYIQISDTNFTIDGTNKASYGSPDNALGPATNRPEVVSLGDGGSAILGFDVDIRDGEGWDFVVFENGFRSLDDSNLAFLELAHVEVSSDGVHFYRFPSVSLTPATSQTGAFDFLDARNIHNLAGKYIAGYGTPFDLSVLKETDHEFLDLNHVKFVKIIDVVGSIDPQLGSFDSQGNLINDPFPTPFPSSGFDLDAVGVINYAPMENDIRFYPNPSSVILNISSKGTILDVKIYNSAGKVVFSQPVNKNFVKIFTADYKTGLYFCVIKLDDKTCSFKFIKL